MSRSRRSGDRDEKKGASCTPVPRPGTMAHLRYVEEQKRKELSQQRRGETLTLELVGGLPVRTSRDGADQSTLTQSAVRTEIGIKARVVIHGAAVAAAAAGGGLAQIPGSGSLVITPIQISMIIALGSLHGKTLSKSSALGVLAAAYGPYVGRTVSQLLIGWIPGVGNAINAATAFVVTESIGWASHNILSDG
jgi:uncharacterized protein (DUF697 family)